MQLTLGVLGTVAYRGLTLAILVGMGSGCPSHRSPVRLSLSETACLSLSTDLDLVRSDEEAIASRRERGKDTGDLDQAVDSGLAAAATWAKGCDDPERTQIVQEECALVDGAGVTTAASEWCRQARELLASGWFEPLVQYR